MTTIRKIITGHEGISDFIYNLEKMPPYVVTNEEIEYIVKIGVSCKSDEDKIEYKARIMNWLNRIPLGK